MPIFYARKRRALLSPTTNATFEHAVVEAPQARGRARSVFSSVDFEAGEGVSHAEAIVRYAQQMHHGLSTQSSPNGGMRAFIGDSFLTPNSQSDRLEIGPTCSRFPGSDAV